MRRLIAIGIMAAVVAGWATVVMAEQRPIWVESIGRIRPTEQPPVWVE